MRNAELPGTRTSDIVVDLQSVTKVFHQRQRPSGLKESLAQWWKPEYREVTALNDISLQVRRGEALAYAGPNGAGKSTTIKLLSGIFAPDRGTVRSLGMDPVRKRPLYVSQIAVVFGQRTELWWDHSVEATFRWKQAVWNIPYDLYQSQVSRLYQTFDLAPIWRTLAKELSLGQRMRADLALATLHDPQLILLDEPTLGLDVVARQNMLGYIAELNKQDGKTIIITSHNMSDLEQLGSRVVLIHNGNLRFDGDFRALRNTVDDLRVVTLDTDAEIPPTLTHATLRGSEGNRHTFTFDVRQSQITEILRQAESQVGVLDVFTERAPIDDVITRVYGRMEQNASGKYGN